MDVPYGLLADALGVLHAAFVLFVVGGQGSIVLGWVLGWGWTRERPFRVVHLVAIGWIVVQTWLGQMCPLTSWENEFRRLAGEQGYGTSFVEYWLDRLLYWSAPSWVFAVVYTLFGAVVLLTFIAYPPRKGRG